MRELFVAEWLRVRRLVAIYAALHIAVLFTMGRMTDLLQQDLGVYQIFAAAHVAAAAAFGAWQMRGHRRPGPWLYLLHRPLAPARIGGAILGAGVVGAASAVAVPIALGLLAQATLTVRVVDTRHIGLVGAAALLAAVGQLAGALLVIAPARHVFAVLALVSWPATAQASGVWALLVQALAVSWLGALALLTFRPDPQAVPRRLGPSTLLALPAAAGLALVLAASGSLGSELAWVVAGSHPQSGKPPPGGYLEASNADPAQLLGVGGDSEPITLWSRVLRLAHRHELTNVGSTEITDRRHGTRWIFSHDAMRFVGTDLARTERRGMLEAPGGFASPPVPLLDLLVDATSSYRLDPATARLERVVGVPVGETLAGKPERYGSVWVVLSDRALRLHDASDPSIVRAVLPLPVPVGELTRVDLVRDGAAHIVSIVAGRGSTYGYPEGRHVRYRLAGDTVTALGERRLAHDYPTLFRDLDFVVSPAMAWLLEEASELFAAPDPIAAHSPHRPARLSLVAALLLALAAAAFTARRAGSLGLPGRHAVAWTLAALALGPPLALAFWLMERQPWPHAAGSRTTVPAPA